MFGSSYPGGYVGNYPYAMNPPSMQNFSNNFNNTNPSPKINVSFVASIDEARAYQTPMDGSTLYLINSSKGEIYSKALAPNGAVDFRTYSEIKVASEDSVLEQLQKRVEILEQQLKQPAPVAVNKKGKGTDE